MQHRESLTHNLSRAYRTDALVPPSGDRIQPGPVEIIHGKKKVDLSKSDPSPANIRAIQEHTTTQNQNGRNREDEESKTTPKSKLTAVEMAVEQLDDFYHEEEDDNLTITSPNATSGITTSSPNKSNRIFMTETKPSQEKTPQVPPKRKQLPAVVMNHPDYSSTMALLQLTRKEVEEHAKDISAISSILTLPGSIELKRTVAKMFADPKHSDEISKQELERKERKYEEDRNRQLLKQADQLKKERELLKQELENLKT